MPQLSATIIALNEERNIARAIGSLAGADEIVVVDSGSSDATCRIAEELGARVVRNPWPGYAAQKNFAAAQARHDWILNLDADEELDGAAQEALRRWKSESSAGVEGRKNSQAAGYRWPRRAFYMGRWIRHSGWYPDWKIRLYDRRRGIWRGDYVHESVSVDGTVAAMAGEILTTPGSRWRRNMRARKFTRIWRRGKWPRADAMRRRWIYCWPRRGLSPKRTF